MAADHEDARLILKLYDLRREKVMREARTWFGRDFHPTSLADIQEVLRGEQSAYLRMLGTYWEMAASLVAHGCIDADLFRECNGEHVFFFSKMEPFLAGLRQEMKSPHMYKNLEKVVRAIPDSEQLLKTMRERTAAMRAPAARAAR
ncbi:MAG: DUF4760 domain-containing protein [Streptosporangiaceae bacterium]